MVDFPQVAKGEGGLIILFKVGPISRRKNGLMAPYTLL